MKLKLNKNLIKLHTQFQILIKYNLLETIDTSVMTYPYCLKLLDWIFDVYKNGFEIKSGRCILNVNQYYQLLTLSNRLYIIDSDNQNNQWLILGLERYTEFNQFDITTLLIDSISVYNGNIEVFDQILNYYFISNLNNTLLENAEYIKLFKSLLSSIINNGYLHLIHHINYHSSQLLTIDSTHGLLTQELQSFILKSCLKSKQSIIYHYFVNTIGIPPL